MDNRLLKNAKPLVDLKESERCYPLNMLDRTDMNVVRIPHGNIHGVFLRTLCSDMSPSVLHSKMENVK